MMATDDRRSATIAASSDRNIDLKWNLWIFGRFEGIFTTTTHHHHHHHGMAGGDASVAGDATQAPLRLVRDVARLSLAGFGGAFKRDCTDLARRVALLGHLLEEIRDFKDSDVVASSSSKSSSFLSDFTVALQAAKRLLSAASNFDSKISSVAFLA